jgi:hypothetical protein
MNEHSAKARETNSKGVSDDRSFMLTAMVVMSGFGIDSVGALW